MTNAELVAELKAFLCGFTKQQRRKRYSLVVKDLLKLQSIKQAAALRYEVLFDEDNYLEGFDKNSNCKKIEYLKKLRREIDEKIQIIILHKKQQLEYDLV